MTSYTQFFSGTATVAGALVGLLLVALSVAPERLRGTTASVEHQAIAATAFTALVDALFVSLIGLQPGNGLRYGVWRAARPPPGRTRPGRGSGVGVRREVITAANLIRANPRRRVKLLAVHRLFPITPPPRP